MSIPVPKDNDELAALYLAIRAAGAKKSDADFDRAHRTPKDNGKLVREAERRCFTADEAYRAACAAYDRRQGELTTKG